MKPQTWRYIYNNINSENNNGIIGKYIDKSIYNCANTFWNTKVLGLSDKKYDKLCGIFYKNFQLLLKNDGINIDLNNIFNGNHKVLRNELFEIFTNLLIMLSNNNVNGYETLINVGKYYELIGINNDKIYGKLLLCIHETLSYKYYNEYKMYIKYCFDVIFSFCTTIMIGKNLDKHKLIYYLKEMSNLSFLSSIFSCLKHPIGKTHLYYYIDKMNQEKLTHFLKLYFKFFSEDNKFYKYNLAKTIYLDSFDKKSHLFIDIINQHTLKTIKSRWNKIKKNYKNNNNESYIIQNNLFIHAFEEVIHHIIQHYWHSFVKEFNINNNDNNTDIMYDSDHRSVVMV